MLALALQARPGLVLQPANDVEVLLLRRMPQLGPQGAAKGIDPEFLCLVRGRVCAYICVCVYVCMCVYVYVCVWCAHIYVCVRVAVRVLVLTMRVETIFG